MWVPGVEYHLPCWVFGKKSEKQKEREDEREGKWEKCKMIPLSKCTEIFMPSLPSTSPYSPQLSLSLCLLCLSSFSPSLSFPVGLWSLSLTYSFLLSPGLNKVIKNDLSTKEQKISGWEWKRVRRRRGERGMRTEKRSEREFGVTGHPELARYCKCLPGNINWIALLISYFTCFHTSGFSSGQTCVFICKNAF